MCYGFSNGYCCIGCQIYMACNISNFQEFDLYAVNYWECFMFSHNLNISFNVPLSCLVCLKRKENSRIRQSWACSQISLFDIKILRIEMTKNDEDINGGQYYC